MVKKGVIADKESGDLQLSVALGKLTGDNLSFIKALKSDGIKSITDFVSWNKDDWKQLITKKNIPLPPKESADTYAENILSNLENAFPSQFILARLAKPQLEDKINLLDSLNILLTNNDKLIDSKTTVTTIDWRDVGSEKETITKRSSRPDCLC